MECKVSSMERGDESVQSEECGVWSVNCRVQSLECTV